MNKEWDLFLAKVLIPRIRQELSLDIPVEASLHKLLLYKTGSFFKPHRDSEKEDGMFGTLVIQLPSKYTGGKLVVRHNNRTENVDFSTSGKRENYFSTFYTAFYCDCEHEVLPVKSGYRMCLVYNLKSAGPLETKSLPSAALTDPQSKQTELFNLFQNEWPEGHKLVYCFSHKYTQQNLSFKKLKTNDRLVAQFFKEFSERCSLQVMIGNSLFRVLGKYLTKVFF